LSKIFLKKYEKDARKIYDIEVTRFEYLKTISYYSGKKDGNKYDKQVSSN